MLLAPLVFKPASFKIGTLQETFRKIIFQKYADFKHCFHTSWDSNYPLERTLINFLSPSAVVFIAAASDSGI